MQEKRTLGPRYGSILTELAVVGELVVRGPRILVPRTLRNKVVKLAHEGHQGITKTKEYPRTRVWFPWIDKNGGGAYPARPTVPSDERLTGARAVTHDAHAQRALERCCCRLFGPHTGEYLLVTVCKQSRWAEVEFGTFTSTRAVIPKMDKTLCLIGHTSVGKQ